MRELANDRNTSVEPEQAQLPDRDALLKERLRSEQQGGQANKVPQDAPLSAEELKKEENRLGYEAKVASTLAAVAKSDFESLKNDIADQTAVDKLVGWTLGGSKVEGLRIENAQISLSEREEAQQRVESAQKSLERAKEAYAVGDLKKVEELISEVRRVDHKVDSAAQAERREEINKANSDLVHRGENVVTGLEIAKETSAVAVTTMATGGAGTALAAAGIGAVGVGAASAATGAVIGVTNRTAQDFAAAGSDIARNELKGEAATARFAQAGEQAAQHAKNEAITAVSTATGLGAAAKIAAAGRVATAGIVTGSVSGTAVEAAHVADELAQGNNNESLVDNAKRIVTSGVAGGLTGGIGAKANGLTESDELLRKAAGVIVDAGGATVVTAGQRLANGEELTGEGLAKDLATNVGSTIAGARAAKNQALADEHKTHLVGNPDNGELPLHHDVDHDPSSGGSKVGQEAEKSAPFNAKQIRESLQHEDALQVAINKEYNTLADQIGLDGSVREVMNPLVPTDTVTGYRRAEYLTPAFEMGKAAAAAGDTGVFYAEIDIRNVSGLNVEMDNRVGGGTNSGYYEANRVMGEVAEAIKAPLEQKFGAENVALVRKGGDEFGIVIKGNRTAEEVQAAFAEAYQYAGDVAKNNNLESIPHPKDGQPGVGIYIGIEEIKATSKMADVLDSSGHQVEDAKKAHAAESGNVANVHSKRDLPPDVIPPTEEQIRKSLEMQKGMADIVDELGVQNPHGKFLTPEEFQKSAMAARAEIFGLTKEQHEAVENFAASHRVEKDLVTGFAPPSERAPTYERLQGYVDARTQLGLETTVSVGRVDLRNMTGLNKLEAAEVANTHFKNIADIVVNEVNAAGGYVIPMRRGGPGFEVAAVGISGKEIDAAFKSAETKIEQYAAENGLGAMTNPKWVNDRSQDGIGIYAASTDVVPGGTVVETLYRTDKGVRDAEREHMAPSVEKYNRELEQQSQLQQSDPLSLAGHLLKDAPPVDGAKVEMKPDLPEEVITLVNQRRSLASEIAIPGGPLDQFLAREGVDPDSIVAFHYGSTVSGRSSSPAKNNRLAQAGSDVDIMVFALDKDGQPWRRMEGQNMHFQVPDKEGNLVEVEVNAGYVADTLDQALSVDYGFDYVRPAFTQDLPPGGIRLR